MSLLVYGLIDLFSISLFKRNGFSICYFIVFDLPECALITCFPIKVIFEIKIVFYIIVPNIYEHFAPHLLTRTILLYAFGLSSASLRNI